MDYIKRIIDDSDYYVVIIKGRYGSLTEDGLSFTEMEYNYAIEKGKPALCFIYKNVMDLSLKETDNDPKKMEKLHAFIARFESEFMVTRWTDKQDLAASIWRSLSEHMRLSPGIGWVCGDQVMDPKILTKIEELRTENEELKNELGSLRESENIGTMLETLREDRLRIACDVMVKSPIPSDYFIGNRDKIRTEIVDVDFVSMLLAIAEVLYQEYNDSYMYSAISALCRSKVSLNEGESLHFSDQQTQKNSSEIRISWNN